MLTVHHLSKSYNLQVLFEKVSFSLNAGERAGLVGLNGCGKTTLLRILAGLETPTGGYVSCPTEVRIGYLPQGFEPDPTATVGEIIGQAAGSAKGLEEELTSTAEQLVHQPDDIQLQLRYDDLLRRIEAEEAGRTAEILAGLGLVEIDQNLPARLLSGGQKTRLSLALILIGSPQILLLDEPTNHLDIAMLEWLEEWLANSPCGVLIVSHDRTFLDNTVTRILEMERGAVREFAGNYSAYLEQRQTEIDKQWAAYKDQQMEIRRMEQDIARVKAQAAFTERQASSIRIGGRDFKAKGYKSYQQGIAKKVARKAVSREKKLERYLGDEERVEKPQGSWQMRMAFQETPHLGRIVIETDDLTVGYAARSPLLAGLNLQLHAGQRIVLTGPNGSGKTTLLRTIIGETPALTGEIHLGSSVRIGYMSQDQSGLNLDQTPVDTLIDRFSNQTEVRTFLAKFLFKGDEPLKPIALLSFGQRARLMLARLVAEECNCLLLDEPVNHLDIPSRTQFEDALRQFGGAVLAIVHDRYFIERFADEVWWVEDGRVRRILQNTGF